MVSHTHGVARSLAAGVLVGALGAAGGSAVAADDFVAAWSFDEGAGVIAHDRSGNGLHGTLVGGKWTRGVDLGGLWLDHESYVEVGGAFSEILGTLDQGTISLWFKFAFDPGVNAMHTLFYLGHDFPHPEGPDMVVIEVGHYPGDSKLYYTVVEEGNGLPLCYDSDYDLDPNRWYHFAVVIGPGFNTGYIDGEEMTDRDYNWGGPDDDEFLSNVATQTVCRMGRGLLRGVTDDQYLVGALDEVRIYDRPLSAAEIRSHYDETMAAHAQQRAAAARSVAKPVDPIDVVVNWGPGGGDARGADLDGDGTVGYADLLTALGVE